MKKFVGVPILLFLCLNMFGCTRKVHDRSPVVTRVDVVCNGAQGAVHRCYTQPKKISRVLNYLRLQDGAGPADEDPEKLIGRVLRIDVFLSDGSHSVYCQHGGRYLSKKYRPWQKIDAGLAADFYQMLWMTPTDA